jgi:hypothetical protein
MGTRYRARAVLHSNFLLTIDCYGYIYIVSQKQFKNLLWAVDRPS